MPSEHNSSHWQNEIESEPQRAFLDLMEQCRLALASNISLRNKTLNQRELNYTVQQTLDRIIFLRICEDRGIENRGQLQRLAADGADIYRRLVKLFKGMDEKYNSALFHFTEKNRRTVESDLLTLELAIDDNVLRDIIEYLYAPESPYVFAQIPADILGQIHEHFVGKTICLNADHQAKVEEKPKSHKAGGVYYTPSYIVDYIIKKTLTKLAPRLSPQQMKNLRILDPACGGGSFLIAAYQFLLEKHLEWYTNHIPEKHKAVYRGSGGKWYLTNDEKKDILLNCIYGVDIDPQAVEITRLTLLLKMLEGERRENLASKHRILPDLAANIQCGNALIGPHFYVGRPMGDFDEETQLRINSFDWHTAFPHIFPSTRSSREAACEGGFDIVIGNPPYGAELLPEIRSYLKNEFGLSTTDTAALMMVQAHKLTKSNGWNGFIVPKSFAYSSNWKLVRSLLLDELTDIVDAGKVWKHVKLEQVIYCLQKGRKSPAYCSCQRDGREIRYLCDIEKSECDTFDFLLNGISAEELSIARKVRAGGTFLSDYTTNERGGMFQGAVNGHGPGKRVIGGKQIQRYALCGEKGFLKPHDSVPPQSFVKPGSILVQNIVAHIENPVDHIKIIGTVVTAEEASEIVILDTANQLYNTSPLSSNYLLGILHSRLINWYTYRFIFAKAIRTMHFDGPVTRRIPIPLLDLTNTNDKSAHDRMVNLVEQMRALHSRLVGTSLLDDRKELQSQLAANEERMNELVFSLYGLSGEEIESVAVKTG